MTDAPAPTPDQSVKRDFCPGGVELDVATWLRATYPQTPDGDKRDGDAQIALVRATLGRVVSLAPCEGRLKNAVGEPLCCRQDLTTCAIRTAFGGLPDTPLGFDNTDPQLAQANTPTPTASVAMGFQPNPD